MEIKKTRPNEIPNKETQQAMKEARENRNMEKVTFDELKKVKIEDDGEDLDMEIEPILPGDPDYELLQKVRNHFKEHPEDYVDFDEIDWD